MLKVFLILLIMKVLKVLKLHRLVQKILNIISFSKKKIIKYQTPSLFHKAKLVTILRPFKWYLMSFFPKTYFVLNLYLLRSKLIFLSSTLQIVVKPNWHQPNYKY